MKKIQRGRPDQDSTRDVEELSGYVDMGMTRQALGLARKILAKPRINPDEFTASIHALCTLGSTPDLRRFRETVEKACERQSGKTRRAIQNEMFGYYCALKDWEKASANLNKEVKKDTTYAVMVMDVLLEKNRLKEAKTFAYHCERLLRKKQDRFTLSVLIEALAEYCARVGEWDKALHFWHHAPLEEPFRRNALSGVVEIHLARALLSVRSGLESLQEVSKIIDEDTALSLPGNDESMTQDAEKELLKYKRGIEKLLPIESRMALGIKD